MLQTLLLATPLLLSPAPQDQPTSPFLELTAADAFVRSESTGRPVLVWFHDPEIPECRRMARIFREPGLASFLRENTIAIKATPGEEHRLASRLAAVTTPAAFLLRADQSLVERIDGVTTAEDFLLTFELALIGSEPVVKPEGDRANDPYAWLAYANHLFSTGNDTQECLAAYLWVLDNGDQHMPGLRARLFEFLLKRIAYNKVSNPDAGPRLMSRRDQLLGRVAAGLASDREVYELTRFNFWLRDIHDTQKTFELLDASDPEQRRIKQQLLLHDLEMIIAYRQYAAVRELIPDPIAHIRARLDALEAFEKDPDAPAPFVAIGYAEGRNRIVGDAALHYEAALAEGQGQTAQELAELVLDRVNTGRAYTLFMSKANRLEFFDTSRRLGARGQEKLGPRGQSMVRTALTRIEGLEKKALGTEGESDR